jgi:hypothetical protein
MGMLGLNDSYSGILLKELCGHLNKKADIEVCFCDPAGTRTQDPPD